MRDFKRVIVELPEDLKEAFQKRCAEDLTDMSTKGRQLIFDYVYASEMAPKGFLHAPRIEQGIATATHRKRSSDDGRAGGSAKRSGT